MKDKITLVLIYANAVLVLLIFNLSIWAKESLIEHGHNITLALAPVDPRSLIQGDYMILSYNLQRDHRVKAEVEKKAQEGKFSGHLILKPDKNGVSQFVRIDDGQKLNDGESRFIYRYRHRHIQFPGESFFFQEGLADLYQKARFSVFKIDDKGNAVLVGLKDAELQLITIESATKNPDAPPSN